MPKVAFTPCLLGPLGRNGALLWLASNKFSCARQRMVVLCQLIPGHYLLSLASDTSYFSPRPLYSQLAKYDYSKSQIIIFMCFCARKIWTGGPTQSSTVPYQLLIVNKRMSFASGVPEQKEKSKGTSVIWVQKRKLLWSTKLTLRNRSTFWIFSVYSVKI